MDSVLIVNEIFHSIQGEGYFMGRLATFVRFAGCNLHCSFCDTKYSQKTSQGRIITPRDLFDELIQIGSKPLVVLTGGEPLTQDFAALSSLISLLDEEPCIDTVAIETNGSIDFDFSELSNKVWVTVSPKQEVLFKTSGNEIKVPYDGTQNLRIYESMKFDHFFLQPVLPTTDCFFNESPKVQDYVRSCYQSVVDVMKDSPRWRLSPQLHKLIGVR